jgi:hypothetical protein
MKSMLLRAFLSMLLILISGLSMAADKEDAEKAASDILASLRDNQYSKLWDSQTGAFFKSRMTKQSFLANMSMGRPQLGAPIGKPTFIDMAYSKKDPSTGFEGEIYAFNYLSSYSTGKFYERIVVAKEKDGKFRMTGLWGAPAQK